MNTSGREPDTVTRCALGRFCQRSRSHRMAVQNQPVVVGSRLQGHTTTQPRQNSLIVFKRTIVNAGRLPGPGRAQQPLVPLAQVVAVVQPGAPISNNVNAKPRALRRLYSLDKDLPEAAHVSAF